MLKQITADFRDTGDAKRMLADVGKLDAARNIEPLLGAGAIVVWLAAQLLFLDGSVTFMGTMKVALISVLATGLVWAVSSEQLRLLRELERQGKELEQRTRETGALRRYLNTLESARQGRGTIRELALLRDRRSSLSSPR